MTTVFGTITNVATTNTMQKEIYLGNAKYVTEATSMVIYDVSMPASLNRNVELTTNPDGYVTDLKYIQSYAMINGHNVLHDYINSEGIRTVLVSIRNTHLISDGTIVQLNTSGLQVRTSWTAKVDLGIKTDGYYEIGDALTAAISLLQEQVREYKQKEEHDKIQELIAKTRNALQEIVDSDTVDRLDYAQHLKRTLEIIDDLMD